MLSSQLLKVFAVICTLNFAQAHELTQGDDKSPAPLVQVNFYGEALCPYCAKFIDMVAAQMHYNGVMNTTSFRYIPYGNAQDTKDGVQCQHGPRECELNRILNCAVHLNYDQNVWFPFAKCIESSIINKQVLEPAEPCAAETGIDYTALHDCATGSMADELQKWAGEETANLKPPHSYVPWVTVNGIPLGGAYQELQTFVCAAYLGERPLACYGAPKVAATTVTHSSLTQVLQQLDHLQPLAAQTT